MDKLVSLEAVKKLVKTCGLDEDEVFMQYLQELPVFDIGDCLDKINKAGVKMSTAKLPHTYYKAISVCKVNQIILTEEVQDGEQ